MSRSPTITDDWLPNDHAGILLASEFMEPLGLSTEGIATSLEIPPQRIAAVVDGVRPVDAELDLRLTRYLGLSAGYFLRLQNSYELLEARRRLSAELDRIIPRAA